MEIANDFEEGRQIPPGWARGIIVYIYKNKGNGGESELGYYRPIFITHIVYKVCSGLIHMVTTNIIHIVRRNRKFGNVEGV